MLGHRRSEFVDCDLDRRHRPIGQHNLGDEPGNSFEEVETFRLESSGDLVDHGTVIDGPVEHVVLGRPGQIDLEIKIDPEWLPADPLLGQNTAVEKDFEPTNLDAVGHASDSDFSVWESASLASTTRCPAVTIWRPTGPRGRSISFSVNWIASETSGTIRVKTR